MSQMLLVLGAAMYGCTLAFQSPAEKRQEHETAMSCGPNSLSLAGRLLDHSISQEDLARVFGNLNRPCTLLEIKEAADHLGFHTKALRCDPLEPILAPIPLIICLTGTRQATEEAHFVVLCGFVEGKIQLLDYPRRPRMLAPSALARHWDGRGVYIASGQDQMAMISGTDSAGVVWLVGVAGGVILASLFVYGIVWATRHVAVLKS